MLGDLGGQRRQGRMLGLVGRPRHGLDDEIGLHEFHHMAFIAGERPTAALAPMAHLRIPERWLAALGDAAQNPVGRPWSDRVPDPASGRARNAVSASCSAGVACVGRRLRRHPPLHPIDFVEQPRERRRLRRRIIPVDIERRLQTGAIDQRQRRPPRSPARAGDRPPLPHTSPPRCKARPIRFHVSSIAARPQQR